MIDYYDGSIKNYKIKDIFYELKIIKYFLHAISKGIFIKTLYATPDGP